MPKIGQNGFREGDCAVQFQNAKRNTMGFLDNDQYIRTKGVISIVLGLFIMTFSLFLTEQLGGMLVIILVLGPLMMVIGFYQLITGKMMIKKKK
ncbi:hypothetical protein AB3N59_07785 [Leptospira sp. WS92.C1]